MPALPDQVPEPTLQQMREIDLPPPAPFWPPAPGWWLLALLLLLLSLAAAVGHYRRGARRRAALATLAALEEDYRRNHDGRRLARGVSTLLRRIALARHGRRAVAGLEGEAWLSFLDRTCGGAGFRHGPGRILATLPYGGGGELAPAPLLALARRWIRCNT